MKILIAFRQLGINQGGAAKSMEKLSSGFRINRAGDDAAGLAISEKMRGQIRGLKQASRNAQDGISLIQTAEGALNETHAILQRMRELAVQSSTDTNTDADRLEIQKEIDQLATEITRISTDTEFNTMKLLNGKYEDKVFHIGANQGQRDELDIASMGAEDLKVQGEIFVGAVGATNLEVLSRTGEAITINVENGTEIGKGTKAEVGEDGTITVTLNMAEDASSPGDVGDAAATLGDIKQALVSAGLDIREATGFNAATSVTASTSLNVAAVTDADEELTAKSGINVSTQKAADAAIKTIDDAAVSVSAERSKLGAMQNRLEHTIANLGTSAENLQAAESRIRDLDMADEIMAFTKNNILQQAATAMLAQANMAPQSVLQLLG